MNPSIREQIRFVLADDNELMRAALDGDWGDENKQMNRQLIRQHEAILAKLDAGAGLTQLDLQLVRDANEIHLNDEANLNGQHKEAVELEEWLAELCGNRLSRP
ncbi:MAG TPA: hypothetical protein ENN81_05260 [Phycisphaerales bacterium]|nr:hypothetical protein [Phycisphaerales bacterium]